jgi:hypothetical protein
MIRSRTPDPVSFDSPADTGRHGKKPATAMAAIIAKTYSGLNEVDRFIIKGG